VAEFVLDGSVALAWYFRDEVNAYAMAVLDHLPGARALVPAVWPLEIGNGVLSGERRGRSTEAQAERWLGYLLGMPITVDARGVADLWGEVLGVARRFGLSAYDAAYLELALRRGLPLATLDRRLQESAAAAGVAAYRPGRA
jgi:predicted nucleic acid-binding protein